MKVLGIGIDLVEKRRLEKNYEKLALSILTKEELKLYKDISDMSAQVSFLMGRFACKEAIIKALNGHYKFHNLNEIEILNNKDGSPYLNLDLKDKKVFLSLSHTKNYATAIAITVLL